MIASWRLELEELWRRECFSTKFWIEPPPALLVSLSWKVFFQWFDVYLGELPKTRQKLHTLCAVRGRGSAKLGVWTSKKGHFYKVWSFFSYFFWRLPLQCSQLWVSLILGYTLSLQVLTLKSGKPTMQCIFWFRLEWLTEFIWMEK